MTKSIHSNRYIISNNSQQHLINIGFRKHINTDTEEYRYNFTVMKYDNLTALRGRITVYTDTKDIKIDVMDNNYGTYSPFYNVEYGNYDVILKKINKTILAEFKKLGIIEYKNKNKNEKENKTNGNN